MQTVFTYMHKCAHTYLHIYHFCIFDIHKKHIKAGNTPQFCSLINENKILLKFWCLKLRGLIVSWINLFTHTCKDTTHIMIFQVHVCEQVSGYSTVTLCMSDPFDILWNIHEMSSSWKQFLPHSLRLILCFPVKALWGLHIMMLASHNKIQEYTSLLLIQCIFYFSNN